MVRLTIRETAEKHGITTAYGLQKAMGISPGAAARLWRGDLTMIALKTLDALCNALSCDLGDLITREAGKKTSSKKNR